MVLGLLKKLYLGFVCLCLFCNGCSPPTKSLRSPSWRQGYALLYNVLSQNAHADKILWVKFESDTVDALIKEVVELCAAGTERIEEFAGTDSSFVELDLQPLPAIEQEARSEIESETAAELLNSSGVEFEMRLLITQLRTLRYAANLSRVVAMHEDSEDRKRFLEDFSKKCNAGRVKIFRTILQRLTN